MNNWSGGPVVVTIGNHGFPGLFIASEPKMNVCTVMALGTP